MKSEEHFEYDGEEEATLRRLYVDALHRAVGPMHLELVGRVEMGDITPGKAKELSAAVSSLIAVNCILDLSEAMGATDATEYLAAQLEGQERERRKENHAHLRKPRIHPRDCSPN